jgi:hypothetical protein
MGISSVLGADPVKLFWDTITSSQDRMRRERAAQRMRLFRDESANALRAQFQRIFKSYDRRTRVEAFLSLSTCLALFKRIVNEVSAPVYNPPPTRFLRRATDQVVFERIGEKVRLNKRMDLLTRVSTAQGAAALMWRTSQRLGPILDVIGSHMWTVIPDPEDATRELGFAYAKWAMIDGTARLHWACWDDELAFELNERGQVVGMPLTRATGHPGFIPAVTVHMLERTGADYWEATSSGSDLEAAHDALGYIVTMTLRGHHTQGHQQPGLNGDPANFPRGQILDGENILLAGEGNTLTNLWNSWDPASNLKTAEFIIRTVAANYGVDLERLNAKVGAQASGLALLERRAETLETMYEAEVRSFRMVEPLSRASADPELRLAEGAELEDIAYPDLSAKTDREAQLRIRKEERKLGYRSVVKDKLEDNPELRGNRAKAWAEVIRDMEDEAKYIELRRAMGIDTNASATEPGQPQEQNGAMGPAVRDGKMTGDQAAEQATKGPVQKLPADQQPDA